MRLVAITTMRVYDDSRGEWRDALDSRWAAFLRLCELAPLLLPNCASTAGDLLEALAPCGLILTGGGSCSAISGAADERDQTEAVALLWAKKAAKPVIGVCRGMQVIMSRAGATVEKTPGHVGTTHSIRLHGASRDVNSFHEYGLRVLPGDFEALSRADDGVVEAAMCGRSGTTTMMWHPERQEPFSAADIELFRERFRR